MDTRRRRLTNEATLAVSTPLPGIQYGPINESLDKWQAIIAGPEKSLYHGTEVSVFIDVGKEYPFVPPVMTSNIYHPNVDPDTGKVYMPMLLRASVDPTGYGNPEERWTAGKSISRLILSFQEMIINPNLQLPVNLAAAREYQENKIIFGRRIIDDQKPRKETVKKKLSLVFDDSEDNKITQGSKNDEKVQKTGSSMFDYDDPPDILELIDRDTGVKKRAHIRKSMAKMAKRSNYSMVKRVRSESTESEEEPAKKPVKRKPHMKKEDADEQDKKNNQYFQTSKHNLVCSQSKKGSDKDSDDELTHKYIPDLDELLKMPERPANGAKTKDEILDEMDKQIADRQKAHEQEMDKLDKDIEAEKRKRIEKKARMKENAKRRNLLETQLTEPKLRELFKQNLQYFQDIWDGKEESSRHKAFHQSIRTRHALYYNMITDPYTDEQLDWTLDEIGKVWMNTQKEHRKHNEYVWKVILSEVFIKFYMDFFSVTKEDAVQMISETPLHKKDQLKDMKMSDESEDSDSSKDV